MDSQVIILLFASVSFISNTFDLPVDLFSSCNNLVLVFLLHNYSVPDLSNQLEYIGHITSGNNGQTYKNPRTFPKL